LAYRSAALESFPAAPLHGFTRFKKLARTIRSGFPHEPSAYSNGDRVDSHRGLRLDRSSIRASSGDRRNHRGILIGPSVFGRFAPHLSATLFPLSSFAPLETLSTVGLVLFLFLVGMELDYGQLYR
jgi:hypothetical protein